MSNSNSLGREQWGWECKGRLQCWNHQGTGILWWGCRKNEQQWPQTGTGKGGKKKQTD